LRALPAELFTKPSEFVIFSTFYKINKGDRRFSTSPKLQTRNTSKRNKTKDVHPEKSPTRHELESNFHDIPNESVGQQVGASPLDNKFFIHILRLEEQNRQ